jgi:hypothetical protein|tara:strand:- start:431 stop:694 length:264 start_codon:yes stop_codon:yes gene_type:complete
MARDRFDLEQDIMHCWQVVDDLKMLIAQDGVSNITVDAVSVLYTARFEQLWQSFESSIRLGQFNDVEFEHDDHEERIQAEIANSHSA